MKYLSRSLSGTLLAVVLAGCTQESRLPLGHPTELRAGESPLDVMCRIRGEFADLDKPLLRKTVFHEETTVLRQVELHLHRERLDAYYEFRLTPEAQKFVQRHTRAELIATFLPLLMHPTWGGEVAVMLMGMPVRGRQDAHHHFSRPSTFLAGTGYRSLEKPGAWGSETAHTLFEALSAIGSGSALYAPRDEAEWQLRGIHVENSLEQRLHDLTRSVRHLSGPHHGFTRLERVENAPGVRSWLAANPVPGLQPGHQAILDREGPAFAVLGLFPQGIPDGIAVHALGLDAYWPLAYSYPDQWARSWHPTGLRPDFTKHLRYEMDGYQADYVPAFHRRVYELALSACAGGPALRDHAGRGAAGALHTALLSHPPNGDDVANALSTGADPNASDASGVRPLCTIVERGAWIGSDPTYLEITEHLLEAGSRVSAECAGGSSLFSDAIRTRNWELVGHLRRQQLRLTTEQARTLSTGDALALAQRAGDQWLIETLLEVGVHPDASRPDDATAMQIAIEAGDRDLVGLFLVHGADPRRSEYVKQVTELETERNDLLEALIEAGAPVDPIEPGEPGPLHIAAVAGRFEQIRRLLAAGADPDLPSKSGKPLIVLLQELFESDKSYALIDLLLAAGADPSKRDDANRTALLVAAQRGDYELGLRLIQAGASVARRELAMALAKSVSHRNARAVEVLLALGADPRGFNSHGMSLLEEAARRDASDVVDALLLAGASPNVLVPSGVGLALGTDIGRSPWRYPPERSQPRQPLPIITAALLAGKVGLIERLIRHGADINRRGPDGLTPLLTLASSKPGTLDVGAAAQRLVAAQPDLSAVDDEGFTALTRAAASDRVSLLVAFARGGADMNAPDARGRRVVEILARTTYQTEKVNELLTLGLEPTETAVAWARSRNASVVAEALEHAMTP